MAIHFYNDEKSGAGRYRVRVTKKSSLKPGIRIDKSAQDLKSEAEAIKVEKKLLLEAQRELFEAESKQDLWKNLCDEWYEAASRKDIFTKHNMQYTQNGYFAALRNYTSDWFHLNVEELTKPKVWLRLDEIERNCNIKTRVKVRTAIDAVFKWAILSERIKVSSLPTEGFKTSRKQEEKMPEILTLDEIRTLLRVAKEVEHEWYPAWALALFTGMRSGELYSLKWSAVDFETKLIYVHLNWTNKTEFGPTKGKYWRSVPLNPQLLNFLKELKLKTGSSEFVLPRYKEWAQGAQAEVLKAFCRGHGLKPVKFHTLRACFGTQLIKDGVAPGIVMKICGWQNFKTMQTYIRLAGIEVKGATDGLKLLPEADVMGRVINLFES